MNKGDILFPGASFNDLVTPDRRSEKYAKYDDILWEYGNLLPKGTDFGQVIKLALRDYSAPVYDVKDANTTVRVYQRNDYGNIMTISTSGLKRGVQIPFNLSWKPGTGNDKIMIIVDYENNLSYTLGHVTVGEPLQMFDSPFGFLGDWAKGANGKAGFDRNNPRHIGVASINIQRNIDQVNDRDVQPGMVMGVERGSGIPELACLVRADRIKAALERGESDIGHMIPLSISTTMHQKDSSNVTPFFLKPATRLEWDWSGWKNRCKGATVPLNDKCVPQGLVIALEQDFDTEAYLDSKKYTGKKRDVVRLLINTLKNRGVLLGAETGCGASALIQSDGIINPESRAIWIDEFGFTDDRSTYPDGNILSGIFQKKPDGSYNFYVVEPPK